MPGKILGLDINHDSIAAVQVASTLKGYEITACERVLIQGENGLDNALKELFDKADLKSDICHSSIPGEHASYRNLRLPFKDIKKIKQTLLFEIETMVPFPVEDLVVDFSIIDRSDQSEILAACIEKKIISAHLENLQHYGVDPDVLEIRGIPTASWLLRKNDTPDNGLFLLLEGKKNTMVLFLNKRIVLVRTFSLDGPPQPKICFGASSVDSSDATSLEVSEHDFKSLCTLVRNTIHSFGFNNNKEAHPEKAFFSGRKSLVTGVEDILKRFLGIPAEQVDVSRGEKVYMDARISKIWEPSLMDNALAIAIRDPKQGHGFNFRKYEFEKKKHYFGPKKEIRKAAVFLIIFLAVLAVDIGSDYYFLKKRNETLDQKITEIFEQVFPDAKRIVDPVRQMQLKISEIKTSSGSQPLIGGNTGVLELLKDTSKRIPENLDVQFIRMVIDSEAARIAGITDTFNTVDKIKNDLESSSLLKAATISSAELDRTGDRVEFEIKLERAE